MAKVLALVYLQIIEECYAILIFFKKKTSKK